MPSSIPEQAGCQLLPVWSRHSSTARLQAQPYEQIWHNWLSFKTSSCWLGVFSWPCVYCRIKFFFFQRLNFIIYSCRKLADNFYGIEKIILMYALFYKWNYWSNRISTVDLLVIKKIDHIYIASVCIRMMHKIRKKLN